VCRGSEIGSLLGVLERERCECGWKSQGCVCLSLSCFLDRVGRGCPGPGIPGFPIVTLPCRVCTWCGFNTECYSNFVPCMLDKRLWSGRGFLYSGPLNECRSLAEQNSGVGRHRLGGTRLKQEVEPFKRNRNVTALHLQHYSGHFLDRSIFLLTFSLSFSLSVSYTDKFHPRL
jgi:hypothetical protein